MSKDDLGQRPNFVPVKRRQLEQSPDVWLAEWANDESLPPSQRNKAQGERDRRKAATADVKVGIVATRSGLTSEQLLTLPTTLKKLGATEVIHSGLPSRAHMACRAIVGDNVTVLREDPQEVIKAATTVVAFAKGAAPWGAVKYAKHRSLPVLVILPDGKEQ